MNGTRLNPFSLFLFFLMCILTRQALALSKLYVDDRCDLFSRYEIVYDVDSPFYGSSSSKIMQSSKYGGYVDGLNCTLRLKPGGSGVILTVQKIDFRSFCVDSIKIENYLGTQLASFCGNEYIPSQGKSYYSSGDMIIRYKTGSGFVSSIFDGFQIMYTGYRSSFCLSDEFECDNLKCIYSGFVCDGYNHCGDNSDQNSCVGTMRVGSFVGLFVGIIAIVAVIIIVAACCRRRRTLGTVMTSPAVAVVPPPYGAQYPPPQVVTQYAPQYGVLPPTYQDSNPNNQTQNVNPLYR